MFDFYFYFFTFSFINNAAYGYFCFLSNWNCTYILLKEYLLNVYLANSTSLLRTSLHHLSQKILAISVFQPNIPIHEYALLLVFFFLIVVIAIYQVSENGGLEDRSVFSYISESYKSKTVVDT